MANEDEIEHEGLHKEQQSTTLQYVNESCYQYRTRVTKRCIACSKQ
jgi:hypothetical protein